MQLNRSNSFKLLSTNSSIFLLLSFIVIANNCFSQDVKPCEINYETTFSNISNLFSSTQESLTILPTGTILKIHPDFRKPLNPTTLAKIQTTSVEPYYGESKISPRFYAISFAMKSPSKLDEKLKYQSNLAINYKERQYIYKKGNLYTFTEVNNDNINWFKVIDNSFQPNDYTLERFGDNSGIIAPALKNYGIDALVMGGYIINEKLSSINIPSAKHEFEIIDKGKNLIVEDKETMSLFVYSSNNNYLVTLNEFNKISDRINEIAKLCTYLKNKKIVAPSIDELSSFEYIEVDTLKLGTPSYSYLFNLQINYRGFNETNEKKDSFFLTGYTKFYIKDCFQDSIIAFKKVQTKNEQAQAMKEVLLDRLNSMRFEKQLIKEGFSQKEIRAIINKEIYVGMSEKGIKYAFGLPERSHEYVWNKIGVIAFDYGLTFQVYFKNGKVIGWYREK